MLLLLSHLRFVRLVTWSKGQFALLSTIVIVIVQSSICAVRCTFDVDFRGLGRLNQEATANIIQMINVVHLAFFALLNK